VVAVEMADRSLTIDCWKALMEAGVYVNLVVPPASPSTNFLLRNSVSAAHTSAQIDTIIAAYAGLVSAGLITGAKAH
jgi:8-amino-7-oxononanoate synthase